MRVLSIESSCDESAVAVLDEDRGLLAHRVFSQVALHDAYGGVVPELASRDHVRKLLPLLKETLEEARSAPSDIDGVAYTAGPGLAGALLTGACLGHALAYAWGVPAIAVHHLEGHLLAPMLERARTPHAVPRPVGIRGAYAADRGRGAWRISDCSESPWTMPRARPSTRPPSSSGSRTPVARTSRPWRSEADPERSSCPQPMLDRPGSGFQLQWLEDRGELALRGGEVDEQARANLALAFQTAIVETLAAKPSVRSRQTGLRRWWSRAGSAPIAPCATRLSPLAETRGVETLFPAHSNSAPTTRP